MPSAKSSTRKASARAATDDTVATSREAEALGRFFADLAQRVRENSALAREVSAALAASGLLDATATDTAPVDGAATHPTPAPSSSRRPGTRTVRLATAAPTAEARAAGALLDPFAVMRAGGEEALRQALEPYESADLQRIIRTHRLDPARISARWSARDRLASLIVDQVRARANHGRAFERV